MSIAKLPKYERVKRSLIRAIEGGRWSAGGVFPSENQLLEQFDVSRPTLVRSLQELVSEGYLYRQKGRGTFVAERGHRTSGGHGSYRGAGQDQGQGFTVFISQDAAGLTGAGREVQLRILRGVQDALGPAYNGSAIRQASRGTIDAQTRAFIETTPRGAALLIEPSFCPTLRHLLEERGWVVWSINEPIDDGNCVFIDQEHAGYLATKFLIDQGCRDIALVNGPTQAYWGFAARRDGYVRALGEAGIKISEALVCEGEHAVDSEAGRMMMGELLGRGVAIDGVVGASDSKAIGAMSHAMERGIDVPGALKFVSIDNTLADQANPALPAVAMPFEEMGFQAATQAQSSAMRGHTQTNTNTQISLRPTLVER